MKCRKYLVRSVIFLLVVTAGIVSATGAKSAQSSNVRAKFRNLVGDAIKSYGQFVLLAESTQTCGDADYVDKTDACTSTNAAKASGSSISVGVLSVLRPIPECCTNQSSPDLPWGPFALNPSRYLVFDFSNGSGCLNIGQRVYDDAATNGSGATPPLNTAQCVDFLEVRFHADQAFSKDATSTSVSLVIDEPQRILGQRCLVQRTGGGFQRRSVSV